MTQIKDSFLLPGESLEKTGVSMIIYGPAGVGKTSNIKTLLGWTYAGGWGSQEPYCKPEEILVVSIDAGTSVLYRDKKLCVSVYLVNEELEKFKDLVDYLLSGAHPFKYVFVDNVSELEKYFVFNLAKRRGKVTPAKEEWMHASNYVRKYMRDFSKNLIYKQVNVFLNFWDMTDKLEDKEGQINSIICPMCMRATWTEYTGLVEHTAYMGISPKSGERFFQFEKHGMIYGKTRSDNLGEGAGKFERANLAVVLGKI
jgi:phage nucleotide-binding protein